MRAYLILLQTALLTMILLSPSTVHSDTLLLEVDGIGGKQLENVEAHVGSLWVSATTMSSMRRRDRFLADAESRAAKALRPYGYYLPQIESSLRKANKDSWLLNLVINPGQAVKVRNLVLQVSGDGQDLFDIVEWQANWPLLPGKRLKQLTWTEQKESALNIMAEQGFLSAKYEVSRIELNLEENVADLSLILQTGPRAVMGDIKYEQEIVNASVLKSLPRFSQGDFYRSWLVDKFRTDLWRSGYFDEIEVLEQRHLDQNPQRVDFKVTLKARKRNTHQGTIGYGTDSQFRMQYRWQQHLLSERGDSLGMGLGWQQKNEELLLFGEYRIPRQTRSRQYWLIGSALKSELEDFKLDSQNTDDQKQLFSERVEDITLRLGKVKSLENRWSQEQILSTMFVQFLVEKNNFGGSSIDPDPFTTFAQVTVDDEGFTDTSHSVTLGMEWDWPVIQGSRFNTSGHHEKVWLFMANDIWGSELNFNQAYLSSRWNLVFSDRWKLLLRGELGYTDAHVRRRELDIGDDVLSASVTELPFLYRFKAGGSRSVRGYGFEDLSNNNIGSNNIITASAELEYQFRQDWSLAAFYDIGNAFNDWGDRNLKAGIGVGLRWYTIAGAIRVDIAQAQNIDGKPWQFHLTIGTPLL